MTERYLVLENKVKKPICPICGTFGACFHKGDTGAGEDYYDLYEFLCSNEQCGHQESQTVYGGKSSWDNWFTDCPYCGQGVRLYSAATIAQPKNEIYRDLDFQETCRIFIPDFAEVSDELIAYLATHPDQLRNLHWRKFEELLEAIFRNHGFHTELGPGRGDHGIDLQLIQKDSVGELITLVQAKRYSIHNPSA